MNQQKVWQELESFKFPSGFNERLCKEQNWETKFTNQAIDEYRKFIFLAKFSSPVTPSKVIDEVWHLHLIYTYSYWTKMCVGILGKMLHHTPGNGNDDEDFIEQYQKTLASYKIAFGKPDERFWPIPKISEARNSDSEHRSADTYTSNFFPDSPTIINDSGPIDLTPDHNSTSFGGGQFGGGGAGADWNDSNSGNDSSPSSCSSSSGDSGGGSSCSSSSCGSSCGGGCGGD